MESSTQAIHFVLNGTARAVNDVPPTRTLLDWLRDNARLTGTKEGCAEGDCGACTVALGDDDPDAPGGIRWQAVNSCLMMLLQVQGRAVLTVEGLGGSDGTLHPAQQALFEADASQCGYCTPGFVMALFAYGQDMVPGEADDNDIHEALAGNLCRCTGYRPIVEAARSLAEANASSIAPSDLDGCPPTAEYGFNGQRFITPRNLAELFDLRGAHGDAWLLAGGTDLGLLVSKERRPLKTVIWLDQVAELNDLDVSDGHLEIGAAVTYSDALPLIDEEFPTMGALIRRIGSRQIRNLGTIGGNCGNASPIGDMPPCLIALDAKIVVAGPNGQRDIPADQFFIDYRKTSLAEDEVIVLIRIPLLANDQAFHCYKVSKRFDQDISAVIGAYRLSFSREGVREARIAYGGMAATPRRAARAEAALTGQPWTSESAARAGLVLAEDFEPIDDFRASAAYRTKVAANLIRRLHLETTAPETLLDVAVL